MKYFKSEFQNVHVLFLVTAYFFYISIIIYLVHGCYFISSRFIRKAPIYSFIYFIYHLYALFNEGEPTGTSHKAKEKKQYAYIYFYRCTPTVSYKFLGVKHIYTLENHCTRTAQSSRGGCSRQVHKIDLADIKVFYHHQFVVDPS